ncbi:PIR protein [Plasmodium ovale]|uniref:PIR Superfamily Protein n=2 Tax=Plasmodium ovale TaxID=36330 RepID=A0A1A8X581_PLAOA|nr:PIR Superfamily Protein [Plasmodium ovale curtisi]SBT83986.1 PIR protein [Plasmodium ovale]
MGDGKPERGSPSFSVVYSIDLPTEKFYNDMKKEYPSLPKYTSLCDTNIVHNNINDIKNICKRILRYLENNTVWSDKDSGYDVCILLNYWIYDELTNIFGAQSTSEKISSAFNVLQTMWKYPIEKLERIKYYQKCKPNFDIFNYNDWKERRKLYEYYVDYSTLFSTANNYDPVCKEYYKKIQDKTSLYEHFEKICPPKKGNCPDFYDKCINYNPKLVLSDLPCHLQMEQEKSAALAALQSAETEKSLQQREYVSHVTESTPDTPEIGTKVGHSVLGVAPVLLTATALYRYTPIGDWIRKLGVTNPSNISNMNGREMDGFFGDSENYISYQPM